MNNYNAYKLNRTDLPRTPPALALRLIGRGIVLTNALIGMSGVILTLTGVGSEIGVPMAIVGGMASAPSVSLMKHLDAQAKLMDINGLLSKRDIGALKIMFNRTQKVKNLLDPYDSWKEVPPDLKRNIAAYINDYYGSMGKLQHALYMAQAQYNKKLETAPQ